MSPNINPNPDPNRRAKNEISKNMGTMEASISDLQGELNVANEPSKNHFKPGWLVITVAVALIVGLGAFLVASRVGEVDKNTQAIEDTCEIYNEQVRVVNEKFQQLVVLFDASSANQPPDQPPPTEEVLKLYDKFREPIPLQDCAGAR